MVTWKGIFICKMCIIAKLIFVLAAAAILFGVASHLGYYLIFPAQPFFLYMMGFALFALSHHLSATHICH
jgi:hypothetical protein